jgi:DNA repair photolyase
MAKQFTRFFAETPARKCLEFLKIQARIGKLDWIDDYQSFQLDKMSSEKRCIIYARKRGAWLKPFHCYHQNSEFEYYSLDAAEGCPFDCVYCYLQSYLNHGALVLFVNLSDLKNELQSYRQSNLWISTGLLTDSLVSEKYFPILPEISSSLPAGSILELRTKSDDVTSLDNPKINREQIVISWSLNPPSIANRFEYRAATTPSRMEAARKAMELGYRLGFHLDPVFHFQGWEEEYGDLMNSIQQFPKDRIAFLSVGLFRYMPDLGAVIRRRFPLHPILTGEFLPDEDGKYHYFREIRKEMLRTFSKWLEPWKQSIPIFWSMEPDGRILRSNHLEAEG